MSVLRDKPRTARAPDGDGLIHRLDAELRASAALEQAQAQATHNQAQATAAARAARAEMHYRSLGLDVGGIAAFHRMLAGEDAAARMAMRQATAAPGPSLDAMGLADERDWIPGSDHLRCPHPIRLDSGQAFLGAVSARGSGNGWFGSGAEEAWETEFWHFPFTPPRSGWYTFRPVVAFRGLYIAQASHDFWTSKQASVCIRFVLHHWQGTWKSPGRAEAPDVGGAVWERGGGNVNECMRMEWEQVPCGPGVRAVPFTGGEPALVSVQLTLRASARGEGSFAEIGAAGDGDSLACRSLLGTYTLGR